MNLVLMHTRKYIFYCNSHNLKFYMLQLFVKGIFAEEESIAKLNNVSVKFNHIWEYRRLLFHKLNLQQLLY